MCGICGRVHQDPQRTVARELLERMCDLLAHRGPDDRGTCLSGNAGLGHTRLSVIDLSGAGHQPMANEDGTIHVVCNGEIYNYRELRAGLESRGHVFRSHTDTETIVHLYEEKGADCLQDLRGMFALALWDAPRQRLLLARDRLGKKPLVYSTAGGAITFASELKALLADPGIPRAIDYEALHLYLTYQYIPAPRTAFAAISKLPPAHYLVWEAGRVTVHRYWQLSCAGTLSLPRVQDYEGRLREVLSDAVRLRLRSDVPFGAFLSGGLDSSLIVALMSRELDTPVKTFSIGFQEEPYNELPHAREVADCFQTDHHEFVVTPDIVDLLPELVWHYNEPYADSSAVPTFYLSRMTRAHVTVALNGDGGDECFSGYPRHVLAVRSSGLRLHGTPLEPLVRALVRLLPRGQHYRSFFRRLGRWLEGAAESPERRYVRWLCAFDNAMKAELYGPALQELVVSVDSVGYIQDLFAASDGAAFLDRMLHVDAVSYLPGDLLVKVDIASMAHGLEVRSPFVDHRVMEFAAALPPELKLKGMTTKYLLKRAAAGLLPRSIIERPKMGFGVPIDRWLRAELREMACDLLTDRTARERGYFEQRFVARLLQEHLSGQVDHCYRIWNLLCLELWHRRFIDSDPVPPAGGGCP